MYASAGPPQPATRITHLGRDRRDRCAVPHQQHQRGPQAGQQEGHWGQVAAGHRPDHVAGLRAREGGCAAFRVVRKRSRGSPQVRLGKEFSSSHEGRLQHRRAAAQARQGRPAGLPPRPAQRTGSAHAQLLAAWAAASPAFQPCALLPNAPVNGAVANQPAEAFGGGALLRSALGPATSRAGPWPQGLLARSSAPHPTVCRPHKGERCSCAKLRCIELRRIVHPAPPRMQGLAHDWKLTAEERQRCVPNPLEREPLAVRQPPNGSKQQQRGSIAGD